MDPAANCEKQWIIITIIIEASIIARDEVYTRLEI